MHPNRRLLLSLPLGGLLSVAAAPARADWKPTERISYVIGVAPGGSVDLYARGIKDSLALQQLKTMAGNAHGLGTFHTGAIAGAVTGLIKADPRDFTPVAMMVEETSLGPCAPTRR
jgi:tripartite-type tricarboxylate transporter receptor subunit TctC